MHNSSFADIIVAFSDFLLALENADEANFAHAKKFCVDALKGFSQTKKNIIGGIEE